MASNKNTALERDSSSPDRDLGYPASDSSERFELLELKKSTLSDNVVDI